MTTLKPTQDLLIVRPLPDPPPVTSWGFELPATEEHADTPLRGLVLAAGEGRVPRLSGAGRAVVEALRELLVPGCYFSQEDHSLARQALRDHDATPARVPMQVKVGDTILYSKHGHQAFRIDGEDLIVLQEASVLGVLE